jgi:hypothetical protein
VKSLSSKYLTLLSLYDGWKVISLGKLRHISGSSSKNPIIWKCCTVDTFVYPWRRSDQLGVLHQPCTDEYISCYVTVKKPVLSYLLLCLLLQYSSGIYSHFPASTRQTSFWKTSKLTHVAIILIFKSLLINIKIQRKAGQTLQLIYKFEAIIVRWWENRW